MEFTRLVGPARGVALGNAGCTHLKGDSIDCSIATTVCWFCVPGIKMGCWMVDRTGVFPAGAVNADMTADLASVCRDLIYTIALAICICVYKEWTASCSGWSSQTRCM